jgi:N-acetylmuramoyl-L-alanine amidase
VRRLPRGLSRRSLFVAGAGAGAAALGLAAAPAFADGDTDYPGADWVPASTANYTASDRPTSYPIQMVVIHVTQETFDDTITLFQDPSHAACAHYVTRSADGYLVQMVREHDIAWHAGNWDYNTRSIGIEHEGWVDDPSWFTDAMYEASAALTADICSRYVIPVDRDHVIGHSEVPGTDHTDPGPYWDWDKYMSLVAADG